MYEGQYLFSGQTAAVMVYSPWMPRGGANLRVAFEAIAAFQSTGSTVQSGVLVYHKNSDETGDGVAVDGPNAIARVFGVGISVGEFLGLKELVRFRYFCAGSDRDAYALIRVLDPVWFDNVDAA